MRGGAGALRDRIALERVQGTGDGQWLPLAGAPDRWAAVEWQGDGRALIRIRYDATNGPTSKRDLEPGMRAIYTHRGVTHTLDIEDVVVVDPMTEVHLSARDYVVDDPRLATGGRRVRGG